jgi:hypothetical protein
MKRLLRALPVVVLTVVIGTAAYAAEGHDEDAEHAGHGEHDTGAVTLEGEIIDITCYLQHEVRGAKHIKCATFCADQGMPFGFLVAETERLYLLLPDGHKDPVKGLRQYFGQQVQVTGILSEGKGLTGLQIETVTALSATGH